MFERSAYATAAVVALVTAIVGFALPVYPGLEHIVFVEPGLINGGEPHGEAGFDSLARMGVRTIISVDGAPPETEPAHRRGMRYVHLPVSYGGIDDAASLVLARAIRDLPRPIYIHCYHGRHRSPAAVARAMVALGRLTPTEATALMRRCGTSTGYEGLYRCVSTAQAESRERIDASPSEFPERARLDGFVTEMAALGRCWERIEQLYRADWRAPPDHPDLVAHREAIALLAHFQNLAAQDGDARRPADFGGWMADSQHLAEQLADALAKGEPERANLRLIAIEANCRACHLSYRD